MNTYYKNTIYVTEKRAYGIKYYPDCDKSKMLAGFAGVQSFNDRMVTYLTGLGYIMRVRPRVLHALPPKVSICGSCGHKTIEYVPESQESS